MDRAAVATFRHLQANGYVTWIAPHLNSSTKNQRVFVGIEICTREPLAKFQLQVGSTRREVHSDANGCIRLAFWRRCAPLELLFGRRISINGNTGCADAVVGRADYAAMKRLLQRRCLLVD